MFLQVFYFICTYVARIDICSFTIDEFAQAFHEKVSSAVYLLFSIIAYWDLIAASKDGDQMSITFRFWYDSCCFQNSLLLGQVHLALLQLLLADVEIQLDSGLIHQASRKCNFLGLVYSVSLLAFRSIGTFKAFYFNMSLSL